MDGKLSSEARPLSAPFFVVASDGCRIAVTLMRRGSASRPPIVLLHALAMDATMWVETVKALSERWTVYAIDCRGHGRSDKSHASISMQSAVSDVVSVLDYVGHRRAVIVGCSMGGTIALAFAARHPERTAGLVAIDTTAWYGDDAMEKWGKRADIAVREGMAALTEFQFDRWFSPAFRERRPDIVQASLDVFLRNDTAAYAASCRMLGAADERDRLAVYTGPTFIIVGEGDYATPIQMAETITHHLPQATLTVIPEARHYTPLETPSEIAECIDQISSHLSH